MPSVNMIAVRRSERKRLEKLVYVTLLVVVGEVAIGLFMLGFMTTRVYTASRQVERLDRQLEKLQPTVQKIKGYEAEIQRMEPRLNLLAGSREQTLLWRTVLQNLSRSMPANTWLASMASSRSVITGSSGEQKQGPIMITLRGTSTSQALIGETMLRLNHFPEFERVDLNYTQKGTDRAVECLEFQIAATVNANEPKKGGGSSGDAD